MQFLVTKSNMPEAVFLVDGVPDARGGLPAVAGVALRVERQVHVDALGAQLRVHVAEPEEMLEVLERLCETHIFKCILQSLFYHIERLREIS